MRRYEVMDIYSLSEARAKESAMRILSQKGMLDIEIGCATPDQLEGDKGYHVNVSYEDPIDHEITAYSMLDTRIEKIKQLEKDIRLGKNVDEKIADIHQNCRHNIVARLTNYDNGMTEDYCLACHLKLDGLSYNSYPSLNAVVVEFENYFDGFDKYFTSFDNQLDIIARKIEQKTAASSELSLKEAIESVNEETKKNVAIRKRDGR